MADFTDSYSCVFTKLANNICNVRRSYTKFTDSGDMMKPLVLMFWVLLGILVGVLLLLVGNQVLFTLLKVTVTNP